MAEGFQDQGLGWVVGLGAALATKRVCSFRLSRQANTKAALKKPQFGNFTKSTTRHCLGSKNHSFKKTMPLLRLSPKPSTADAEVGSRRVLGPKATTVLHFATSKMRNHKGPKLREVTSDRFTVSNLYPPKVVKTRSSRLFGG